MGKGKEGQLAAVCVTDAMYGEARELNYDNSPAR